MRLSPGKIKEIIEAEFAKLSFVEETHSYYVDGVRLKYSVSGLIKRYVPYTNWDEVRERKAKKLGISSIELQKRWDIEKEKGCALGDDTHIFGEHYVYDKKLTFNTGHKKAVVAFWDSLPPHIIPLMLEARMYHFKYLFAGTSDILLYNTFTGEIIIADYKTNKDLFKNFNKKKMLPPFNFLLESPFGHYNLQLSYYQILLEQVTKKLGLKVINRVIVFLKEDATFELYETQDLTEMLENELINNPF